jgi:hypothetical protein
MLTGNPLNSAKYNSCLWLICLTFQPSGVSLTPAKRQELQKRIEIAGELLRGVGGGLGGG